MNRGSPERPPSAEPAPAKAGEGLSRSACPEPVPSAAEGLSRRALLAAACAAPVLSAASPSVRSERSRGPLPSEDEALHSAWNRALTRFRHAEAAVAALEGTPDDDAFNRAADAQDRALERLLAAPAPDLPALAAKLRQLLSFSAAPPRPRRNLNDRRSFQRTPRDPGESLSIFGAQGATDVNTPA